VRLNFSKVIGPAYAALRSALYLALLLARVQQPKSAVSTPEKVAINLEKLAGVAERIFIGRRSKNALPHGAD
jgi:hypothetical protein